MSHLDTPLPFDQSPSFLCPTLWMWISSLLLWVDAKVRSVGHHYLIVPLVHWSDWTSSLVSDAFSVKKGRPTFHVPWFLSSSNFLPMFPLACGCSTTEEFRLCRYFCVGIFCSSFQASTVDFFISEDANCILVPFSPENILPPWHSLKSCSTLVASGFDMLRVS